MPIYDFKCRGCGHVFDELLKVGATPESCPSCGGNDLERLFSFPAVSTESSRRTSLGEARQRAGKVRKEQQHAQREYERNYVKDHS